MDNILFGVLIFDTCSSVVILTAFSGCVGGAFWHMNIGLFSCYLFRSPTGSNVSCDDRTALNKAILF